MAKYQKYAEYKDSGVDWLGEIPQKWSVWKLNHFAPIVTCGVAATPEYQDEGIPFLSAQNVKKKKIDLSKGYKFISTEKHEELTRNRKPEKGDILLSRVGTIGEGCIVDVDFEFSIFVSLTHLRLIQKVCMNEFFIYLTESSYIKALHGAVTLVGGGVGNLNVNDLREYKLPIPSVSEQSQIANFLDHETAKIDTLIAKQEKLIELLKEKRQAVISHAVTKGLNQNVKMKDSGVEWLGKVPEHWTVKRLKHISPKIGVGLVINPSTYTREEGVYFIFGGDVKEYEFDLSKTRRISKHDSDNLLPSKLNHRDLVSIRVGYPGVTAVVTKELEGANCASIIVIRRGKYNSDWLCAAMNIWVGRQQVELASYGAAQKQFNVADAIEFKFPVPPANEQDEIAIFVEETRKKFDNLSNKALQQIELLKERRTALISAAVTGKIDVRHWQNPNKNNNQDNMELSA